MKTLSITVICLMCIASSFAQILNPVKFSYSVVKKGTNLYEVHIKTVLDPKWHIYSVKNPEGGAEATEIKLNEGTPVGTVKENGVLKTLFDKEFKVNQKFYEEKVDFVQVVKLPAGAQNVTGNITYMICNDKQCLPPKAVDFKIKI